MASVTSKPPVSAPRQPTRSRPADRLPRRSPLFFRVFRSYARRYIRRHFHALRLSADGLPPEVSDGPLIVVANHPSWWDPLIFAMLTERMPSWRTHFGPIEVQGLAQYPFLEKLGLYGVETGTTRGRLAFLRQSLQVLARREATLWITAQGQFVDPRDRAVHLKPGIGHLARRLTHGTIVPLALEYPFWNDRCPEALAHFGSPMPITPSTQASAAAWTARVEQALEAAQDRLAELARKRDGSEFTTLIGGTAGVGGVYDRWRRLRARIRGEVFQPEHRITTQTPT